MGKTWPSIEALVKLVSRISVLIEDRKAYFCFQYLIATKICSLWRFYHKVTDPYTDF